MCSNYSRRTCWERAYYLATVRECVQVDPRHGWVHIRILQLSNATATCCGWVASAARVSTPELVAWHSVAVPSILSDEHSTWWYFVSRIPAAEMDRNTIFAVLENLAIPNVTTVID